MQTLPFSSLAVCGVRRAGGIRLPLLLALGLVVAIALRVGVGAKAFVGEAAAPVSTAAAAPAATAAAPPDVAALEALHLFEAPAAGPGPAPASAAPAAAQTALNLRLEGVVIAATPEKSVAIIVSNAAQGSYRAGDSLPAGTEVRLDSIAADHVILSNRGERETLWLYTGRADAAPPSAAPNAGNPFDAARRVLTGGATPAALAAAQRSLAEVLMLTPAIANGALIGYRLTPGEDLREFMRLGFRTNDVVTGVNGIALDDMGNLPQLYSLMNEATEVSFSLLRDGKPVTLQISTGNP